MSDAEADNHFCAGMQHIFFPAWLIEDKRMEMHLEKQRAENTDWWRDQYKVSKSEFSAKWNFFSKIKLSDITRRNGKMHTIRFKIVPDTKIKLSDITRRNGKMHTIRFKIVPDTIEFQCHLEIKKIKFFHSDSFFFTRVSP